MVRPASVTSTVTFCSVAMAAIRFRSALFIQAIAVMWWYLFDRDAGHRELCIGHVLLDRRHTNSHFEGEYRDNREFSQSEFALIANSDEGVKRNSRDLWLA